jgi:hypothetical protein
LLIACTLALGVGARGDTRVPHRISVRMLLKALSYDRNLVARSGEAVRVGALVRASHPDSERDGSAFVGELREILDSPAMASFLANSAQGLGFDVALVAAGSGQEAGRSIQQGHVNVVYLTDGWSGVDVRAVVRLAEELKLLVVASTREQVEAGAALGVFPVDGRPRFVVNVAGAMRQGAQFDSGMLRMADVVR